LTIEDETDRLSGNIGMKLPLYAAYKIPEERRSHVHRRGSLKSHISEEHTATVMTVFLQSDNWCDTVCSSETLVPI
jgi:hypothetical protein